MPAKVANRQTRERVAYLLDVMEDIANDMVSLQLLITHDVQCTAEELQDPMDRLDLGEG